MAEFLITAPDGKKYKVTGATREGALAALKKKLGAAPVAPATPANPEGTGVGRAIQRGAVQTAAALPTALATADLRALTDVNRSPEAIRYDEALRAGVPNQAFASRASNMSDPKQVNSMMQQYGVSPQANVNYQQVVDKRLENREDAAQNPSEYLKRLSANSETAGRLFKLADSFERSPTADAYAQSLTEAPDSFMGWLGTVTDDPLGFMAFMGETIAESVPQIAAGAATTTVTGNPVAGAAVMSLGGLGREYANEVNSFLSENGIDLSDPEATKKLFANKDLMDKANERGLTRGLVVAAADFAGQGLVAQQIIRKSLKRQAVAQGGSEASGEALATKAVGDQFSAKDTIIEGLAGAGSTVGEATVSRTLFNKDGKLVDPANLSDTESQAAASLANRIRTIASQNGFNLKDVGNTGDAKQALEAAHEQISGQIKEIVANPAVKKYLNPKQAKTLDQLIDDYAAAQVAIRQGKNKVKSKVTQENFDAIMRLLPPTVEAQQIANLMREGNQLTDLFKNGTKGGISQFTDTFNPFTREDGSYDPSKVISGMANKGVAIATMGGSLPYQFGAVGAGRAIDAVTGRRSAVNRFVNKYEGKDTLPDPSGPSLIAAERLKKEQDDARAAELGGLPQVDKDNSPVGTILSGTGLDRDGLKAAMTEIEAAFPDVKALEDVFGDIRKNLDGGTNAIRNLNDIIPVINQHLNTPDTVVKRAAAPDQLLAQRGGVNIPKIDQTPAQDTPTPDVMSQAPQFGPQFTTQENYNRGIEANQTAAKTLDLQAQNDPNLSVQDKAVITSALDKLQGNLGTNPVMNAEAIVEAAVNSGVPQEAIDAYIQPYVDRVTRQQSRPTSAAPGLQAAQESGVAPKTETQAPVEPTQDDYTRAVDLVTNDQMVSASYVQRKLDIPYDEAVDIVQRMEDEGLISKPNHVGVRKILRQPPDEPILGSINPDIPAPTTVQTAALSAPTPVVHQQIKAPEGQTNHGLLPHLRVEAPTAREGKPLVLAGTNNKNASRQIDGIDEVLARHEDPAGSSEAWASMLGDAMATKDVPVQPHGFIEDLNNGGAQELLSTLTPGQIADADHGFRNAAEFRQAYTNGEIGIEDTGRLFLWSFLSRGVSPYTQEGLFMDSFNGIEEWIRMAAGKSNRGSLTDNIKDYEKWAKSAAPKGSGQPGAGATHNLNAFGNTFLMKMSQDAGKGDGRSRLQVIHDMMSDPNTTGKEVRREFLRMGEGVGIDNKVVSFTLLVAGYDDVMVLDRVQMRQMWNDGRFSGINLYDGYKSDGKPVTGSALSSLTYGARGLLVYEAMEKSLQNRLSQIYSDVGRPDSASVGRYHWETWVASSQQEASHGTIDAILKRAKGDPNPLEGVTAKEGEYGAYAYGARYGVENGVPMFTYEVPGHGEFKFTVPDFQKFLEDIKKPKNKVVPTKFKVTESGNAPWYTREGVNLDALAEKAKEHGKQIRTANAELQQGPTVPDGRTLDAPSGEPILGSRSPTEPILRDTSPGANPDGPRPDVIPAEKPQVTPAQYKQAVVELIRPQFQIGLKGGELEDGISNFNDAVEFAKKLGIVVRLAMSQNELNTLLKLDTGQDPAKIGAARGMFQRKGPKKQGKGTEGTIWAMKPGADKGDGTSVTDIEALTTLLHEISHAITLGPLDGKGEQEVYSYFINRKQSSKPGTGIVGRSDFTPPGSFTDSAIKPLLDADWEQMSPTQKKAYAEIVDLQENVEAYSPKNPNERRVVRFIRQVMSNPGYSQETKQTYKDYTRMAAEFAVDPVWVYLINPKLAKKLMPVTSKMIQQEFRKADNKVIQFYAHPLAVVMAALVALEMAMDDEEERKQQQMPPGALNAPMAPGMLSQA
jgi:hypothetical protein